MPREKSSRSIVIEIQGCNALISNGSMMLLKYKLNNVCDANHRPANGAQRTMIILIYHNMLWLSISKCLNKVPEKPEQYALRIISVLNAYYRHVTKIMRIACVLKAYWTIYFRPLIMYNKDLLTKWRTNPFCGKIVSCVSSRSQLKRLLTQTSHL